MQRAYYHTSLVLSSGTPVCLTGPDSLKKETKRKGLKKKKEKKRVGVRERAEGVGVGGGGGGSSPIVATETADRTQGEHGFEWPLRDNTAVRVFHIHLQH